MGGRNNNRNHEDDIRNRSSSDSEDGEIHEEDDEEEDQNALATTSEETNDVDDKVSKSKDDDKEKDDEDEEHTSTEVVVAQSISVKNDEDGDGMNEKTAGQEKNKDAEILVSKSENEDGCKKEDDDKEAKEETGPAAPTTAAKAEVPKAEKTDTEKGQFDDASNDDDEQQEEEEDHDATIPNKAKSAKDDDQDKMAMVQEEDQVVASKKTANADDDVGASKEEKDQDQTKEDVPTQGIEETKDGAAITKVTIKTNPTSKDVDNAQDPEKMNVADDKEVDVREEEASEGVEDTESTYASPIVSAFPRRRQQKRRKHSPEGYPKRPLSAYNFFFQDHRERILSEAEPGDSSVGAGMVKDIAGLWRSLPAKEHKRFDQLAKGDLQRYRDEVKEYEQNHRDDVADDDDKKGDNKRNGQQEQPTYMASPNQNGRSHRSFESEVEDVAGNYISAARIHSVKFQREGRLLDVEELNLADRAFFAHDNIYHGRSGNTSAGANVVIDVDGDDDNREARKNGNHQLVQLIDEEICALELERNFKLPQQLDFSRSVYQNLKTDSENALLKALDAKRIVLGFAPLLSPLPSKMQMAFDWMTTLSRMESGTTPTDGGTARYRPERNSERGPKSRRVDSTGGGGIGDSSRARSSLLHPHPQHRQQLATSDDPAAMMYYQQQFEAELMSKEQFLMSRLPELDSFRAQYDGQRRPS